MTKFSRIGKLLLFAALALLAPAHAAPPVMQDATRPRVSTYDTAANKAGFSDWGKTLQVRGEVHVTVRLEDQRLRMLIILPAGTPPAQANAWFGKFSDAMGWKAPFLYAGPHSGAYILRADVPGDAGLVRDGMRIRGGLPLDVLQQQLKTLSPLPALVAVRTVGGEQFSITPKPDAQTISNGDRFHFYYLGSSAPIARLALQTAIPARRVAAAITALLLWLLVPPLACFILREHARQQEDLEPMLRLQLFRRWLRGITLGSLAGMMVTFFTLCLPLLSLVPSRFAGILPATIWFPLLGSQVVGRLVGLPLERAAWPQRQKLPWYRMLAGELIGTGIVLVIFAGIFVAMGRPAATGTTSVAHIMMVALGVPVVIGVCTAVWARIKWSQRQKGLSKGDTEAPLEVQVAVFELTTRLEVPVDRVVLVPPVLMGGVGAVVVAVKDKTAILSSELAAALNPAQIAALVAAAALLQPRTPRARILQTATMLGAFLPLLIILPMAGAAALGNPRALSSMMPLLMLCGPVTMILTLLIARRTRQLQENADFRVAEETNSPRLLVDALRTVEEVTASSAGMDAKTASANPVLIQRRTQLQKRVGLD